MDLNISNPNLPNAMKFERLLPKLRYTILVLYGSTKFGPRPHYYY